jgi:hypothetical protein
MNLSGAFRLPSFGRRPATERARAAEAVLGICATVDTLADDAHASLGVDDDRLFSLLEQREQMLADLSEHVATLRLERPTADSALFAASEKVVEDSDALISEVCVALTRSNRTTMALAVRVQERVEVLRAELESVQRAGSAGIGYAKLPASPHLDRFR